MYRPPRLTTPLNQFHLKTRPQLELIDLRA